MLHLLYILAFTTLALIAVSNLIRNLIMFSVEGDGVYSRGQSSGYDRNNSRYVPHPEFLDSTGKVIKGPLLVARSIDIQDARAHLDALYEASPGYSGEVDKEN